MIIKTKMFESDLLLPLATPDGTSLEEQVNTFLATLPSKNVLDTIQHSFSSAKYGMARTYTATVVYKV